MKRIVVLGLTAAVVLLGCAKETGDDDDSPGLGTGGVPSAATGGSTAMAGKGGSGGTTTMTAGSGGGTSTGGGTGGVGSGGTAAAGSGGVGSGGATAGSGGAAGTPDGGTPPEDNFKPPCATKGADLALLGDSYINYLENLEPRLTERAIADGALSAGQRYDDHAVAGTSLANAFTLIPPQWSGLGGAKSSMPKFVVMDGGGNDIIIGNMMCEADGVGKEMDQSCQDSAENARMAAFEMIDDMKASGVKQVLYFYYPNAPIGGHDVLDWAFKRATTSCAEVSDDTFKCYMVDLRPVFEGHDDWFAGDGIHPNSAGADALADTVWARMKTECMAQSATSGEGCCTP